MVEPLPLRQMTQVRIRPKQDVALSMAQARWDDDRTGAEGAYQVKTVIVADRIEERLAMAKQSGADWTLNTGQHSLAEFHSRRRVPTLDCRCRLSSRYPASRRYLARACGTHCSGWDFQLNLV